MIVRFVDPVLGENLDHFFCQTHHSFVYLNLVLRPFMNSVIQMIPLFSFEDSTLKQSVNHINLNLALRLSPNSVIQTIPLF